MRPRRGIGRCGGSNPHAGDCDCAGRNLRYIDLKEHDGNESDRCKHKTGDTYDGFARQIARRSGLRCLSVEYERAPEHPFPAPLDDCIAAVRWAASDGSALGIDGSRLALVGDSAGAA